jgi:short-subunit dehydrogenase
VTQACLPLLRQARGRIVNVSSIASIVVAPFHGPYSATKWAVNGLSNALRLELLPLGVHVALLICGSIQTPIWDKAFHLTGRIVEHFPPEALQLYGRAFSGLREAFLKMGREGVPPEHAARAIGHALTARRPKNTYFVGPDARQLALLQMMIHGRLRDRLILHTLGLSGRPEGAEPGETRPGSAAGTGAARG